MPIRRLMPTARGRALSVVYGVVVGASSAAAAAAGFDGAPAAGQLVGAVTASMLSGTAAWMTFAYSDTTKKTDAQFAMSH
ncbi:MAG TPA: hypothetical protein VNV66_07535 [Pilimelia sp.]|nr:hypothetical protein [Pilimelia sp.]